MQVAPTHGDAQAARLAVRRMRGADWVRRCALVLLGCFVVGLHAPRSAAEDPKISAARLEFSQKRAQILVEAGTTHAKVGTWSRDAGLVQQATAAFLRAVEVSEGKNVWAQRIVNLMQTYEGAFWRTKLKKPSAALIRGYDKRLKRAAQDFAEARFKLAAWADKKGLEPEALAEYQALVREENAPIVPDEKGQLTLSVGKIPADYSARLLEAAIQVNGQRRVRDAFLESARGLTDIFMASNEDAVTIVQSDLATAQDLALMLQALIPHLEVAYGGRPTRPLRLIVFSKRADYEAWCEGEGLASHKPAAGFADSKTWMTVVCGEGISAEGLRGMALHESTHLFQYGVSPAIMPSWYNEGMAETFGGEGTFSWDGKQLEVGGSMPPARIRALAADDTWLPLSELVAGDALSHIQEKGAGAHVFYDLSWAFMRFLRTAAGAEVAERFEQFELLARGAALGAEAGSRRSREATESRTLFQEKFGADLPGWETTFRDWVRKYEAPGTQK